MSDESAPEGFAQALWQAALGEGLSAWAELDADQRVVRFGGDWGHFGWEHPQVGQAAMDALPLLLGELPARGPLQGMRRMHAVQWTGGAAADLTLFPLPQGTGLLAYDVSAQVAHQGRMQQEGNQLSLVTARLAGKGLGSALNSEDDLLSLLKMAVFEADEEGRCRALGTLAPWAEALVEENAAGERTLVRGDGLGFLDNFLEDALEFWRAGAAGHLTSGVWCEGQPDEEERCYEALAVLDEQGRRNLVLERVDARFQERQRVLQRARQAHLSLETLEGEVHKKEVLLQCIVHDLRGPLSNMMAVLSLLDERDMERPKEKELLALARRQADKQDRMMRELLDIFAAEVRALQSFEAHAASAPDLGAAVEYQVQHMGPAFEEKGVRLSARVEPGPWPVVADADRLDRVLRNLVGNALHHAPAGSEVELWLHRTRRKPEVAPGGSRQSSSSAPSDATAEEWAELSVLDRGPGVAPDKATQIFDRFVQSGLATSGGTVGLGLYFCRNAVQTWGGRCGYRDREGGGADFWVQLRPAR